MAAIHVAGVRGDPCSAVRPENWWFCNMFLSLFSKWLLQNYYSPLVFPKLFIFSRREISSFFGSGNNMEIWSVLFKGSNCTWFSVSIARYDVGRPVKEEQFRQALKSHWSYWDVDVTSMVFPYVYSSEYIFRKFMNCLQILDN